MDPRGSARLGELEESGSPARDSTASCTREDSGAPALGSSTRDAAVLGTTVERSVGAALGSGGSTRVPATNRGDSAEAVGAVLAAVPTAELTGLDSAGATDGASDGAT